MTFPTSLPTPRTPDAKAAPTLRWGILGPGSIAAKFTESLQQHSSQQVVAVGSRSAERAGEFAGRFGITTVHGSYDDLVADADVDIVYVATPHNHHHPDALRALRAGKHVLVEKPMALNAAQVREIEAEATSRGLFAMEALWTLFLPKFDAVRQILEADTLGTIHTVLADHGQHFDDGHRILDPALAGGPMLDLMTYPASFAHWVLGEFDDIVARTTWAPSKVTGQTSILATITDGPHALLSSSVLSRTPTTAAICGTDAMIEFDGDFYVPGDFTLSDHAGNSLRYTESHDAHVGGLHWQAAEAARRIDAGETSSPLRTLADTIATMEIMDAARAQIGETYPEEG